MSVAAVAFLYMAIATSGGAIAFLAGQRSSGKTPREVEGAYEQAVLLESVAKDLRTLCDDAAKAGAEGREELESAKEQLDDAIFGLQRGADLVV